MVPARSRGTRRGYLFSGGTKPGKGTGDTTLLLETCSTACSSEQLLQTVLNRYGLTMDWNQQVLVGSTIRSYLSYLLDQGMLEADFSDNMLTWKKRSPQEK